MVGGRIQSMTKLRVIGMIREIWHGGFTTGSIKDDPFIPDLL